MKIKITVAMLAAALAMVASADVKLGEIGTDFEKSLEYAKKYNVPIVVTWGNTSCGYCETLAKTLANSDDLHEWIAEKQILFVEKHEEYGSENADYVAAGKWIASLDHKFSGYPYMGVYWVKSSGAEAASTAFTARKNMMAVKTPKNDLAGQIIGTLESLIGDYEPGYTPEPTPSESGDASFVSLNVEEDRLEATATTGTVYVPVKRNTTDTEATNILKAEYDSSTKSTTSFKWSVGQETQAVPVVIPAKVKAGKSITLSLCNANGGQIAKSTIHIVAEPDNHPTNPHWVGEYSAGELPYGEWTMDYDTAKSKLRTQGGYMVAVFSGVKWCPHCIGIDDSLFADKKFYSWAKKNKVILVLFDQPRFNSDEQCQYAGPRLLSYDNEFSKSGAAYLSRNGINGYGSEVLSMIDLQWELTREWLAPESTAFRLSNPTVLLLDSTGNKVAARMNKYELSDRTFPTAENLNRLSDLLLLVDGDESEGYRTVSPLQLEVGSTTAVSLQVNDTRKFLAIGGVKAGEYLKITASSSDQDVAVTLYSGSEQICSGTGRAITDHSLTAEEIAAGLSVKVSAFGASAVYGAKTTFSVAIAAEVGDEEMVKTVDFDSLTKAEQQLLNRALYKKQSMQMPVYEPVNLGGKRLVGTLSVSMTSRNKISAKFAGDESVSFSGVWKEINLMSGTVTTSLFKGEYVLELAMDAEAGFTAVLTKDGSSFGGNGAVGDYQRYVGAYTVTLVEPNATCGTGYLTVKVSKTGKATVVGTMPDGTSISLSSSLSIDANESATLPIYKVTKKGTLSVALEVEADAADTWGNEGNTDTVRSITGCFATWGDISFNVFGGYWKSGATPLEICEMYDLSEKLTVKSGDMSDTVVAVKKGFTLSTKTYLTSLSFAKATGVFSGKAKVSNSQGKTVSAVVKGVLLPGWIDCGCTSEPVIERPYGSGTIYYTDKINGESVVVSQPMDIEAVAK